MQEYSIFNGIHEQTFTQRIDKKILRNEPRLACVSMGQIITVSQLQNAKLR